MNADDIVNQFANTLQNHNSKPSSLYGENKTKSDSSIYKVKVSDVMTIISKQLKAYKNADSVRKEVRRSKTSYLKPTDVVPDNYIPMKIQSNTEHKVETQCILDTQLINLIKHAESVIDVNNDNEITNIRVFQEIENSDLEKNDVIKTFNEKPNKTLTIDIVNIDDKTCQNEALSEENLNNVLNSYKVSGSGPENIEINNCINDNNDFKDSDRQITNELEEPNSPILGIVKPLSKPQRLIYTLEEFDRFESLAAPVLNEITDFEDAKQIINTQLRATDVFVKKHSEIVTTDKAIECSNQSKFINNDPKTQYSFDINSGFIDNNVIEDEMLFDSDDDIQHSEELPPTCSLDTSLCNKTEDLDKTMYVGFQTASNHSIQILSDSFKKAQNVFDNVSKTVAENLSITELVEAFDKKESHETDVIKECDNAIIKKSISTTPDAYQRKENTIEYKNIMPNSNNPITEHIDEHIMREFENNLMSCEDNVTVESINEKIISFRHSSNGVDNNNKNYWETNTSAKNIMDGNKLKRSDNPNLLLGFKTASNKKIQISDQALTKVRNIFDDIDLSGSEKYFNTNLPKESNNDFVGFKTANNKMIKISTEALIQTKNIFDNIDNEISSSCQEGENKLHSIKQKRLKTEPVKNGFINSPSLKNMKRCASFPLKEPNIQEAHFLKNNNSSNNIKHKIANQFQTFKTASNKNVVISDKTLEISKKIFQDIERTDVQNNLELEDKENEIHPVKNITCLSFKGFKTANNKPIKISDEALLKTKTVFQDIENGNIFPDDGSIIQPSIQQSFETDNKNTVTVLQEALCRPKILTQDIKDKDNKKNVSSNQKQPVQNSPHLNTISLTKEVTPTIGEVVRKPCFAGFQTASKKSVKISEEAFIKSKKIFEDLDINNENKDACETDANFKGFCTASDKKVHISEDALAKTAKVFENLCDKNQYCEEELKKNIKAKLKSNIPNNINIIKKPDTHKSKEIIIHEENKITESIHVEDFLNTELIKIFDESLDTEDFFEDTTPKCKRSGSPILSSSKTKKKKFVTPKSYNKIMDRDIKILKPLNLFKFDENYKKTKKYKLSDILAEKSVNLIEDIDPYLLDFNFDTFLKFRFENNRNDIDSGSWTTDQLKKYFTDSVNKRIIPEGWIDNHIKLIIWKLISYELFFPKHMKYACSIKNVLQQLKYRYDRELYNVQRPALRKILEKDDVSTKRMVLCVASLYVDGVSVSSATNQMKNIELLLTDGWYCVKAKADSMIDKLIIDRKISIGSKLAIYGAELTNCEQGISPWEDTSAVRLKISGNSTKRVKWDARLGFHGNGAIMSRLTAVTLEGGKISKLRVFVTRVYPTMYVEKFEDGSTVTRSERLEHLHQMKFETERQLQIEKIYEEVMKMSEKESDDSEEQYTEQGNLETGSQISRLMKKSKDPLEFKASLTSSQAHMLNEHTDRHNEKLIQKIQNKARVLVKKRGLDVARNVVPLMKLRVFDKRKAMLTIWRPNESLLDIIKEGAWIDVYNVVPTSIRYSEIQISAGRQSMFCKSKLQETDRLRTLTQTLRRKCYTIKDLQSSMTTNYNEIDTFGLVFLIEPRDYDGSKELFQNVYLSGVDKSIISVNFWGGVKKFGFENILEVGQIVTCINLQKRAGNTRYIPQYRATEYTYFTKTPKFDSARKLLDELSAQILKIDKHKMIQECVDLKNNYLNFKYSNTENVSPYRMNNSEYNISRNKMFIDSPLIGKDRNSNLESESNFKETRELSPNSLLRKKKVNEKIAKLRMYGEPPPLNHIHIINKSSKAIRPYKSPLISNDTSNAANMKNVSNVTSGTLSENKISSPVLNRTFVKINPVKINFALEEIFFAEELESPPLSLDLSK